MEKMKNEMNVKDVHENLRSAVTSLYFCIAAYWLRINMNDSFWMETCFARPNTIIDNEETGWKQFLKSQIKTSAKELTKSTSCFRINFSPRRSEFAYVCLTFELALESKLRWIRLTERKKVNFDYITNRERDLHASFVNARGRHVRRVNGTQKNSVWILKVLLTLIEES